METSLIFKQYSSHSDGDPHLQTASDFPRETSGVVKRWLFQVGGLLHLMEHDKIDTGKHKYDVNN